MDDEVWERRGIIVFIHRDQSVCPIVGIRPPTSPPPAPKASVYPPLGLKGGGQRSIGGEWVGGPNSDD
jgi:hypothetical protein